MNFLFNFINNLITKYGIPSSVREVNDPGLYYRITITNQLSLFSLVSCLSFSGIYWFYGAENLAITVGILSLFFPFVILFNSKGWFLLSRTSLFLANLFVMLIMSNLLGKESGIYFIYFPICVGIFVIFASSERLTIAILFTILVAEIIFLEWVEYSYFGDSQLPDELKDYMFSIMLTFSLLALVVMIVNINYHNDRSNKKLTLFRTKIKTDDRSEFIFLNKIFDSILEPIFIKDENLTYILVNNAFVNLVNKTKEDFIGKTDLEAVPSEYAELYRKRDIQMLNFGIDLTHEERYVDENGIEKNIITKKKLYLDENNNRYIVGIIEDITERKRNEQLLREYTKEIENKNIKLQLALSGIESSNLARKNFFSNFTQDFRTPLNAILNSNKILMDNSELPKNTAPFLEAIQNNSNLLLEMINSILSLSNLESGSNQKHLTTFTINQVVEDLYNHFIPMAKKKSIEFKIESTFPMHFLLEGDVTKLCQALKILIDMGIKSTNKGKVELSIRRNTDIGNLESSDIGRFHFTITDTGHGLDIQSKNFTYRSYNHPDNNQTLISLDLALCREFIKQLGGNLEIKSTEGKGTRFWFTIPIHEKKN
ncbi:sensor histidine kinase [Leptospira sp. GIMC2001]|uniref:sensor histidine kinase n=1 Tax=Leptospira sp. GIMC2001 TaxID=1513297 RepID=UPI0023497B18|nr:PAS domain-containing sensor histidine kinase [Leptospira sp. GIMC2001]WCL49252.1 PAS domain-containing sensor histidine kinase [Leptospira sp. GIMC2001]